MMLSLGHPCVAGYQICLWSVELMLDDSTKAGRRVLVIDDNPAIHDDVRKVLGPALADTRELAESEAMLFGDAASASTAELPVFHIDSAYQGQEGVTMVRRA